MHSITTIFENKFVLNHKAQIPEKLWFEIILLYLFCNFEFNLLEILFWLIQF